MLGGINGPLSNKYGGRLDQVDRDGNPYLTRINVPRVVNRIPIKFPAPQPPQQTQAYNQQPLVSVQPAQPMAVSYVTQQPIVTSVVQTQPVYADPYAIQQPVMTTSVPVSQAGASYVLV